MQSEFLNTLSNTLVIPSIAELNSVNLANDPADMLSVFQVIQPGEVRDIAVLASVIANFPFSNRPWHALISLSA